jgi:electron transport complex protein RnfG
MTPPEAGPVRMISTLGVAGLCAGLAVVAIFLATRDRIERNRAEALEAAIFRVLDSADRRETLVLRDGRLVPLDETSHGGSAEEALVYAGYDASGRRVGFAIPAQGAGFQDTIALLYGYDPERRRIVGMEVLESRETPGLGDKIVKDRAFLARFENLAVEPRVELVKEEPVRDNQVDAISGATISSAAVVRIINDANARWIERLDAAAGSPPDGPAAAAAESEGAP